MSWEDKTIESLRESGYRTGAARRAVVSVLARGDCCRTVPEIAAELRAEGREVGIASVYRVVDLLAEQNLVQKLDLGHGRAHCGRVEPFADDELEAALRRVERDTGFAVASHDVLLRGACDDCRDPSLGS